VTKLAVKLLTIHSYSGQLQLAVTDLSEPIFCWAWLIRLNTPQILSESGNVTPRSTEDRFAKGQW